MYEYKYKRRLLFLGPFLKFASFSASISKRWKIYLPASPKFPYTIPTVESHNEQHNRLQLHATSSQIKLNISPKSPYSYIIAFSELRSLSAFRAAQWGDRHAKAVSLGSSCLAGHVACRAGPQLFHAGPRPTASGLSPALQNSVQTERPPCSNMVHSRTNAFTDTELVNKRLTCGQSGGGASTCPRCGWLPSLSSDDVIAW